MKFFYVYKTINQVNGKFYIGKHESYTENDEYLGSGFLLGRAIKKYGIENFKKEILEFCEDRNQLNEQEKFWIEKENSLFPNGYNIAVGGAGGDVTSHNPNRAQIVKNVSEAGKKRYAKETLEEKVARIANLSGRKRSDETKIRISKGRKGMKFSDEHRANISKACIEYMKVIPRYNQKKIDCYDLDNNFLTTTNSIAEASRIYNQNNREICNMCKGKKHKIKNFIFRYHE